MTFDFRISSKTRSVSPARRVVLHAFRAQIESCRRRVGRHHTGHGTRILRRQRAGDRGARRARGAGADHCVDVTGAVIEGEFGLYRPQTVDPRVIPAPVDVAARLFPGSYDPRKLWGRHLFHRLRPPVKSCRSPITRCRCRRRAIAAPGRPTSEQVPADLEPPAPPLLVAPQI